MAKYNTAQKEALIHFMSAHSEEAMTVAQMTELMRSDSTIIKPPSESTVYRLIKELVSEGTVKRTVKGVSREFLYQITDAEACHSHLHMKCTVCGTLMHMDSGLCGELMEKLDKQEGFELDSTMVLTGVCKKCK